MKALLAGLAAIAVIAVAVNLVLSNAGFGTSDVQSGAAVRLD